MRTSKIILHIVLLFFLPGWTFFCHRLKPRSILIREDGCGAAEFDATHLWTWKNGAKRLIKIHGSRCVLTVHTLAHPLNCRGGVVARLRLNPGLNPCEKRGKAMRHGHYIDHTGPRTHGK